VRTEVLGEQVGAGDWSYDHAHFKGAMRRMLVPMEDEYDEQEYEEAGTVFLAAMKMLIAHSRCAQAMSQRLCVPHLNHIHHWASFKARRLM
jgi:hypothetical protein